MPFPSFSTGPITGGLIVFVRRIGGHANGLATIKPDGTGLTTIPNTEDATDAALSPDGTVIAYARTALPTTAGPIDPGIWTMHVDGSNRKKVASVPKFNAQGPAWSPDGKRLAFVAINANGQIGPSDLYLVDADGSHLTTLNAGAAGDRPSWSPDGKRLAFESAAGGGIWTIGIGGGGNSPLTTGTGSFASWAPDGHRLLFERQDDSDPNNVVDHIFVIFADGSSEQQVTSGPTNDQQATWSPDGRAILFAQFVPTSNGGAIADLTIVAPDGSQTKVTNTTDASEYLPSWR
jgi:Tol biopolymer transport system component